MTFCVCRVFTVSPSPGGRRAAYWTAVPALEGFPRRYCQGLPGCGASSVLSLDNASRSHEGANQNRKLKTVPFFSFQNKNTMVWNARLAEQTLMDAELPKSIATTIFPGFRGYRLGAEFQFYFQSWLVLYQVLAIIVWQKVCLIQTLSISESHNPRDGMCLMLLEDKKSSILCLPK